MLKRKSPKPLYAQLEEIVREKIESGEWGPHDLIPSENELSRMYNMSRMTVRSVLTLLAREGLIYRVPGKGTFVAAPKITTGPLSYMGIREQLERMGYEISTKILRIDKIDSPQQIAKKLELRKGQPVYVLERVRYIKEEPISLHLSYIPLHMCEGLEHKDLEGEQLCVILDREYELTRKGHRDSESIKASPYEAKLFSVKRTSFVVAEDVIYSLAKCLSIPRFCSGRQN